MASNAPAGVPAMETPTNSSMFERIQRVKRR